MSARSGTRRWQDASSGAVVTGRGGLGRDAAGPRPCAVGAAVGGRRALRLRRSLRPRRPSRPRLGVERFGARASAAAGVRARASASPSASVVGRVRVSWAGVGRIGARCRSAMRLAYRTRPKRGSADRRDRSRRTPRSPPSAILRRAVRSRTRPPSVTAARSHRGRQTSETRSSDRSARSAVAVGAAIIAVVGDVARRPGGDAERLRRRPGQPAGRAGAPDADPDPDAHARPRRRPRRRSRHPSRRRPRSRRPPPVPAPLTGELVPPDVAARHPIAVMIDDLRAARPQSGLSSAVGRLAGAGRGRHPALHGDLPGHHARRTIGPVRSSRYYYIAWAAEWRAVYVHSGGSPQALATLRGEGQRPVRLQRRRVPLRRDASSGSQTRFAPHNLYTTGTNLRSLGKRIGAKDKAYKTVWQFAPDAPLEARPYGGTITVHYPYNTITYKYDRKTQHLPALGHRREEADRRRRRQARIAPKNVVVMRMRFGPLNDGHPEAPRSRPTSSAAARPGSRPTAGRSRAPGRRPSMTKPTRSTTRRATRSR